VTEVVRVQCPYCRERVELYIDPETSGTIVQDCDVCCHPWEISIDRDPTGEPHVTVNRAQ
jgi:hypothetical protein